MAARSIFFNKDTPHGLIKRFMYKRYLQAYVATTQQSTPRRQIIIYDAFAGSGLYGDEWPNAIENYGSPLIALRVVIDFIIKKKELKHSFKPRKIKLKTFTVPVMQINKEIQMPEPDTDVILNFSEAIEGNCIDLVNNIISVLVLYGVSYEISSKQNGRIITILSRDENFSICCNVACIEFKHVQPPGATRYRRCLTFIDPFGFKQIPMHHLQTFIGQYREVLINFMSSFVNRFKTREENEDGLLNLFGFSNERGRRSFLRRLRFGANENDNDGINRCVRMYEEELKLRAQGSFLLTFQFCNKQNARLYHLIFITNHIKGFAAMKEAMNRGSQEPESLTMSDYQVVKNGMQFSLGNDQNVNKVADKIFQKFQGSNRVAISQIKEFILFETPYVWRKKPLKILQKQPADNPRLTAVVDAKGDPPTKRGTFPNGTNWLLTFRRKESDEDLMDIFQEL